MKKFWKILGLGALAVGLTPYKIEKNAETGESSYQALLWRITSAPGEGDNKREIGINLGEGTLTSMLLNAAEKSEEPHLFSDELCVEYAGADIDAVEESDGNDVTEAAAESSELDEAAEASEVETAEHEDAPEAE